MYLCADEPKVHRNNSIMQIKFIFEIGVTLTSFVLRVIEVRQEQLG